jgi:hypothetical protein
MVWILAFFLTFYSQARILVVSDIDDTLKVTNVASTASVIASVFDERSVFAGMSELFQLLNKKFQGDIEFHYVSLAPKVLFKNEHREFLAKNGFPVTRLYMNPRLVQDPMVKISFIREIIQQVNPKLILYFGDNGQADTEIYDQLQREFNRIPSKTFIREAYSKRGYARYPTKSHQIGFVTPLEVALALEEDGVLLNYDRVNIENMVATKIRYEPFYLVRGEFVFPNWQDCRDFQWRWGSPDSDKGSYILQTILRRCLNK